MYRRGLTCRFFAGRVVAQRVGLPPSTFNARSESMCEKASFRRLVPNNRCLVAVEGFYEWKKGPKKQPYYIHFKDGRPLVFAALYDSWKNAEGEILCTFTIVTTNSSSALEWLHDRMPVILGDEASTDLWLNGSSDNEFSTLLKPYEKPDLACYPVTPAMNKASFDGPECIKEGAGESKESNKAVKRPLEDVVEKTNLQGNIKEEVEAKPSLELSPSKDKGELEKKVDVSSKSPGADVKAEVKREYEQFLGDSKLSTNEQSKLPPIRTKKRKVMKSGAEKQTTLRSFFSKS